MPRMELHAYVDCPAREVYQMLKNMERYPAFMNDVLAVQVVERSSTTAISQWVTRVDGLQICWTEEDRFDDEHMRITYRQIEGDLTCMSGTWQVRSCGEQAEVVLDLFFDLGIPMLRDLFHPLIAHKIRENSLGMLAALKKEAEKII